MRPIITKASLLDEHSSWRKYIRGLQELIVMEAPASVIDEFKYRAARDCFLAFADIMKSGDLKVVAFHEVIASAFEDLATKRYKRLIVSCPPRSGKSMMASMFVAWLLGRDQQTQHIIASYGQLPPMQPTLRPMPPASPITCRLSPQTPPPSPLSILASATSSPASTWAPSDFPTVPSQPSFGRVFSYAGKTT